MTLSLPDDVLAQAGISERDALIEFACRLFDAQRLDLRAAARLAGLSRTQIEEDLRARHIAIFRPTLDDIADEEAALRKLGEDSTCRLLPVRSRADEPPVAPILYRCP